MSAGTGPVGRLRSRLYARLEEMSFRSGAAACAAVLVVVAVAITLAIAPGNHRAAPPRAAGADPVPGSAGSAVPAVPASARSPARPERSASHPAGRAAPDTEYVPEPGLRQTAPPQASSAPWSARVTRPAEPAWSQARWPPSGLPPAWMPPRTWAGQWPGQQWLWRDRGR